jgi:hypothetical protein
MIELTSEQEFEDVCLRLEQNDAKLVRLSWWCRTPFFPSIPEFDDSHCIRFGRALSKNTNLKQLELSFYNLTSDSPRILSRNRFRIGALADGVRLSQLTEIRLYRVCRQLQQLLFDAIQQSISIQSLILCGSAVDFMALSTLLAPLGKNQTRPCKNIVNLTIYRCHLSDNEMSQLSLILHSNKSITNLTLSGFQISDDAIAHFIELWKPESLLKELRLTRNGISPRGALLLIKTASNHPSLEALSLDRNDSIGYDGLTFIGQELGNVRLLELNIKSCINCGTAMEIYRACRALADGLQANSTIQKLDWDGNRFGLEGLRMLMKATTNRHVMLKVAIEMESAIQVEVFRDELRDAQLGELLLTNTHSDCFRRYETESPFHGALESLAHGFSNNRTLYAITLALRYFVPSNEAEQLMRVLGNHPTIQCLHLLTKGTMRFDGLQTIGEHLASATTLKALSLNGFYAEDWELEDDDEEDEENSAAAPVDSSVANMACLALANGLRDNRYLQELNLYHREMQFPNALELVRAAANHPSLQKLSLDLNLSVSLVEVRQLADVLGLLHLKEFLTDFRCSWSDSEKTSEFFAQAHGALLEGVGKNFFLHKLTIPTLDLTEEIGFYMELNRLGRIGLIHEQGISPARWCDVLSELDVPQIFYFFSEQPSLVSLLLSRVT